MSRRERTDDADPGTWTWGWRRGGSWFLSGIPVGGEAAVVTVAVLFVSGGAVLLVGSGHESVSTFLFNAFMYIGLALAAIYGAVVLRRSFEASRIRWLVAVWYVGGILVLHALYTWANLTALRTGAITPGELIEGYVLFGNLGGVLGLIAGFNRGRAAQNRRLVDELETRNETLEFVNHMLRHDVLNGAQTIQGYTELLDESLDPGGEDERYLENIRTGGTRITDLVENVRVVMDTVTGERHRTVVGLSELVAEEVDHARDQFPGATFETDIQPDVEAVGNTTFRAVVTNLLQNAVEHNDTDSPTVSVSVVAGDERAVVRIADDGPGFPEGLRDSVFERGEKSPASRGMGIGLYLVEVLVEAVDGSVTIEDNEPRGAVVTVALRLPEELRTR